MCSFGSSQRVHIYFGLVLHFSYGQLFLLYSSSKCIKIDYQSKLMDHGVQFVDNELINFMFVLNWKVGIVDV